MNAKTYRIISASGIVILEKSHRGDLTAKNWLASLIQRGILDGLAIQLQRRTMSDAEVAKLPPFANGTKQTPWSTI